MAYAQPLPAPLNEQDEVILLEKCKRGDKHAEEKMIEHNIRLVIHIGKKFKSMYFEDEDIFSVGSIGLIKAVRSYNAEKNIRFVTYASKCIENEILMLFRQVKRRDKEDFYDEALKSDGEGNLFTIFDTLGTDSEEGAEEKFLLNEQKEWLMLFVDKLPERERTIVQYRFGLGCNRKGQKQVAEKLNVSQSYVSRIEKKVVGHLKEKISPYFN